MKAEVNFSQVYYNSSLMSFFFRTQAEKTLDELLESVKQNQETVFQSIEDYSEDLDEIEELFYNESLEDIAKELGLTIEEEEEEEE